MTAETSAVSLDAADAVLAAAGAPGEDEQRMVVPLLPVAASVSERAGG
jgi:hypothetical protein